jgi:hypothetical protein
MAQDEVQLWAVVNTAMNCQVPSAASNICDFSLVTSINFCRSTP